MFIALRLLMSEKYTNGGLEKYMRGLDRTARSTSAKMALCSRLLVYEWNEQSIVTLEKQATGVFVRQEVSADNECEEAEEPITEDQVK